MIKRIISIDHHRNGVSGAPFNPVIFEWDGRRMLGIIFSDTEYYAVLDLDIAAKGDIRFFHNSWRGDNFAGDMAKAKEAYLNAPDMEARKVMEAPEDPRAVAARLRRLADELDPPQAGE